MDLKIWSKTFKKAELGLAKPEEVTVLQENLTHEEQAMRFAMFTRSQEQKLDQIQGRSKSVLCSRKTLLADFIKSLDEEGVAQLAHDHHAGEK